VSFIELSQVTKTYRQQGRDLQAVRGVDLRINRGETVALVGESGCGKSTLGRLLAGTSRATSGQVTLDGTDLYEQCASQRAARRRIQMVFQHPQQSLNPKFTVESTLREPLRLLPDLSARERAERLHHTMGLVGLEAEYLRRRPAELSGGQQQRVALARALMSEPDLIVLDEPTSSLDQSVRRRTIALLRQVQERTGVAYLFITHDLATVPDIAHRVCVMYLGRIVEQSTPDQLFSDPGHPYTRALIAAAPTMTIGRRQWGVIRGETPSASDLPRGCAFRDRCPMAVAQCAQEDPLLLEGKPGHWVECFRAWETPSSQDVSEVTHQ
jgi:oligopeptide/dipeptide ABC transporter ATP-binding protein